MKPEVSEKTAISLILALSLLGRLVAVPFLRGISGGDFFNFLLITKELVRFHSPFIAKRLPFYPLLLIPGHLLGHPIGWAKILGVLGSLGSLVVLYLLGRQLKIKKEILYLALIFTSFQSTLFLYSLRPLTHTLFTFEVLLSLYLFHRSLGCYSFDSGRTKISQIWLGVVLGMMSMTRHEGFVVAAVLYCISGLQSAFRARSKLRYYISSLAVFLAIVAPYFISNYLRFGSLIYSGYMKDPGLNRVVDFESLLVNFEKVKWIILNLWGSTGYFPIKWILVPAVLVLLIWVTIRGIRVLRVVGGIGLLVFWVGLYFWGPFDGLLALVSFFFACLMALGGLKFIIKTKWRGMPLLLVLLTQTILLLLVQPWARHLQHTFPFWALFLALGVTWIFEGSKNVTKWGGLVALSGVVLLNGYGGIRAGIESHQRGVLPTLSLFQAVDYVRNLPGPIAFESDASWIRYHFGDQGRYLALNLEIPPVDEKYKRSSKEQWEWILANKPKYLVRYSQWDGFSLVDSEGFGSRFQLIKSFESIRDGEEFTTEVYRVLSET